MSVTQGSRRETAWRAGCAVAWAFLVGCATGSAGRSADDGSAGSTDAAACPSGDVSTVPSGACSSGEGCVFVIDAMCGPGVRYIPEGKPVYLCDCTSGAWQCALQSGGPFGLVVCDASAD